MGKPSIFSSRYKKHMKKRKKRSIIFIILLILIIIFLFLLWENSFLHIKVWVKNNVKYVVSLTAKKQVKKVIKKSITPTPNIKKDTEENSYSITVGSEIIQAVYEKKDNSVKFDYITPLDSTVYYRISPDGKKILFFDSKGQIMYLIDSQGKVTDITAKDYISTSGTQFKKEDTIKEKPAFVWATQPVFLDNDNIAYISQLPYIKNDPLLYIWIYNINSGNRISKEVISGYDITFGEITSKGITVVVDSKTKYLNSDFVVN
ncbi:MAG TPA: hypothetical protein VIK72_00570 [Clostridiaceae bacterium]